MASPILSRLMPGTAKPTSVDSPVTPPAPAAGASPLKTAYVAWVEGMKSAMPHDQAMELAIGGHFDLLGPRLSALVRHYGLPADGYLIDVGCGSGRLSKPISEYLTGRYLGIDLVPDLVEHARKIADRPDWRFETIDHIEIPEADNQADVVCFFSVMTHLTHEQSYWYLQEASRVLKPGGKIVFSFLEFLEPGHWQIFEDTLHVAKSRTEMPMNVFMGRGFFPVWAEHLGLVLDEVRNATDAITDEGALGQSLCVMSKPLTPR